MLSKKVKFDEDELRARRVFSKIEQNSKSSFVYRKKGNSKQLQKNTPRGKEVVIIGGGDTALEEADFLTRFASKVTVIHRRNELRASAILQERARSNPKINWKLNYTPKKVLVDKKVTGIELLSNETGNVETLNTDGIFVAIGRNPNTDFLEGKIELDKNGYIITKNKSSITNISGVFAAGDVQDNKYQQAIVAAGSGAIAALDVEDYLIKNK